ncbi:TAP-like protein-domain-containing protein [Aspergillus coremiiformis]|uniref:TAP-like protein-domain-containing protein n=1 Tax=Aspergillus coremiiformis TaxID=138285 RepID=A0A5N6Z6T4_9EURO|nr:TAP-like protein-domain-containing protein [Aspergillus coremiiformis]
MAWHRAFLFTSLIGSHAIAFASSNLARSENIAWGPCEVETLPASIQCGNLTVPVDYTEPDSDTTLQLQLLKVPALHEPKQGSILFNFGGPGLEARLTLAGMAETFHALTGGHYDLIAHDPRGTASTLTASCFANQTQRATAVLQTRLSDFPTPADEMALGKQWAGSVLMGDTCSHSQLKDHGRFMSTAFTARDLMQIVDAVSDDGMLRYWGFSYGTVLGSTVAAMFPDRVDKLILDAVMNPHQYYHECDIEIWSDVDKVFTSVFQQCLQSPKQCVLAGRNQTAEELEESIYALLDGVKRIPVVEGQTIIDHSFIKTFIRASLYSPKAYPNLAAALNTLLDRNTTKFMELWGKQMGNGGIFTGDLADDSPFAIPCSEKRTGKHTLDEIMPDLYSLVQTSKLLGEVGNGVAMVCSQWKIDAKERYEGNFEVTTKNPLLIIGNTYDSATPFKSAQNISASFEGSVLLEHGGWGHGTLSHGSSCTSRAIRNYWTNGALPEAGTKCEPDYPPFQPGSLQQVLIDIGFMDKE